MKDWFDAFLNAYQISDLVGYSVLGAIGLFICWTQLKRWKELSELQRLLFILLVVSILIGILGLIFYE